MRELTISLNTESSVPLYEQIYRYIREDIRKGQFRAGDRLPSGRSLAAYLQVSRSTVDLAYEQLLSEGYIESVPCKGYYVCHMEGLYHLNPGKEPQAAEETAADPSWDFDFTPNGIDLHSFPYGIWRKITRTVLLDDSQELFQLGDPRGERKLRESISRYLHQARGVSCQADQVILGAGNDYLFLLLTAIFGTEHKIAMESPTYKHAYRIFEQMGFSMTTVPMDEQGMCVEELEASGADIAYVMPSHQYPMGVVMPIKRRLELLKWASEKKGRYLIEDDYDSEFRYKGKPVPALQGTDVKGNVIYLGTFSKSVAPAIRISYLVLPRMLIRDRGNVICRFSSTVSRIDQMILHHFLEEGHFERHLNRMRALYGKKHEILLGQLRKLSGICVIRGEYAGVHLLLEFQNGMSEEEIIRRAGERGVRVYPLSEYTIGEKKGQTDCPAVLLGYATLTEEELLEASQRLVEAWSPQDGFPVRVSERS